jgi:hypothetical protein
MDGRIQWIKPNFALPNVEKQEKWWFPKGIAPQMCKI